MTDANKAIKPTYFPVPRPEDIKAQLSGCTLFTKLDFKSAFNQLSLSERSQELTVFYAMDRLMKHATVTMGAHTSSGELSKALAPLLANIPQAHIIHDDIIIGGKGKKEHDQALWRTIDAIAASGMTLNKKKCMFGQEEVPFWGLIVSKKGLKPDPIKIEALNTADHPRSKAELRSFLCMVQANKEFIPGLSTRTANMRKLLKQGCRYKWNEACESEFSNLKQALTEDTLLRHYEPHEKTYIWVDAHVSGLGAVLLQGPSLEESKPVAFASRATTVTESRHAQLGKLIVPPNSIWVIQNCIRKQKMKKTFTF